MTLCRAVVVTDRIRSMGEGNVFTRVWHSVHNGSAFGGRGSVFGGERGLEKVRTKFPVFPVPWPP